MIKEHIIEVLTDTFLIFLPLDLMYIYFYGGWYETNPYIEWAELMLLPCIMLLGIFRVWKYCRKRGEL